MARNSWFSVYFFFHCYFILSFVGLYFQILLGFLWEDFKISFLGVLIIFWEHFINFGVILGILTIRCFGDCLSKANSGYPRS